MFCLNNIKVHHIGYAVEDIEKAKNVFLLLGYKLNGNGSDKVGGIINDNDRNIKILMLSNDNTIIELISFLDKTKKSPIDFLFNKKLIRGGTPYHICYTVENIENSINYFLENKFNT